MVTLGCTLGAVSNAWATYSAPLTEVRIDETKYLHTPSIVRASERRTIPGIDVDLSGWGLQYLGQFEWSTGFGILVGVAGGFGQLEGNVGIGDLGISGAPIDTDGFWVGGQLRAYHMLWKSDVDIAVNRPSAVTAFINLRTLYYDMSSDNPRTPADVKFFTLTGGLGAMAEWSISDYVSICPYAWLTPGVSSRFDYTVGGADFLASEGFTLRNPLLVGIDVWIYTFPPNWTDHIALSVLGSFIDTEGDDQTISFVIGYTF